MIVDTSALLAIVLEAPEAERVAAAIFAAPVARISTASFVEAAVVIERRRRDRLARFDQIVGDLGFTYEPVTYEQALAARGGFRRFGQTRHPARLNFGDCFAYALAATSREPLLFKGDDFSRTDICPAL